MFREPLATMFKVFEISFSTSPLAAWLRSTYLDQGIMKFSTALKKFAGRLHPWKKALYLRISLTKQSKQ
jgi:hypothetical protein